MTPAPQKTTAGISPVVDGIDSSDMALRAAARSLTRARRDYDDALDRGALMHELQLFDGEVARAERVHSVALSARQRLNSVPPATGAL